VKIVDDRYSLGGGAIGEDSPVLPPLDQYELQLLLQNGYRLTPATMAVRITNGRWIAAPHLLHISSIIANAVAKGGQFVIVTMPPRHGKSELCSVHTPIWYLDNYPQNRIILASYGAELATEFALKVRDTLLDEDMHPLLRVRLRSDRQRIDNFKTTDGGGMISIGVGGSATGKGANLLLVDDYVKNAEEALSDSQKQKTWEWFLSTAYTRLEPNATIIVLATRWDRRDLIGMILEKFDELVEAGFDPPTVINLPALARDGDPLARHPGMPLWPQRYDELALRKIRTVLGTYWWSGLYQQDPPASMSGLELGKKLRLISREELPHRDKLKTVRAWDMAGTPEGGEAPDPDFLAGPLMHRCKETDRLYISEAVHARLSPHNVELQMRTTAEIDGPGVKIYIEQEPGSSGKWAIEHIQDEVLPEFDVEGEKSTGPIEVRAQPFLAKVEAGEVYCVRGAYVAKLSEELDGFPGAAHDDLITGCALGYRKLFKGRFGGIIWGKRGNREGRAHTSTSRIRRAQQSKDGARPRKRGRLTW
jgi:predicted phage terminase large subunit-like protein